MKYTLDEFIIIYLNLTDDAKHLFEESLKELESQSDSQE